MKPSASARILLPALALIVVLAPRPAAAQGAGARAVSVGAAAGLATPLHGDFNFTAAAWQADVRFDTARHFGFGVFVEEWRHTEEEFFTPQAVSGLSGGAGTAERIATRTEHRTRALGWNLIGRGTASRVTISGGGGVSYLVYSRDFRQTTNGCDPACGDSIRGFDNGSFAAQLQAGVDVGIAPRLAVMGQFRAIFPIEDPGGGHHTIVGGVRVVF